MSECWRLLTKTGLYISGLSLIAALVLWPVSQYRSIQWETGETVFNKRGASLLLLPRGWMLTWDEWMPSGPGIQSWNSDRGYFTADFDGPFRAGQTRARFRKCGLMYADYMAWKQLTWTHYWNIALAVVSVLFFVRLHRKASGMRT